MIETCYEDTKQATTLSLNVNKYYSSASHHEQKNKKLPVKLNFWQSQWIKLVLKQAKYNLMW